MSKITNDGLTRSATGRFIAVYVWQQWESKGKSCESEFGEHKPDKHRALSLKAMTTLFKTSVVCRRRGMTSSDDCGS